MTHDTPFSLNTLSGYIKYYNAIIIYIFSFFPWICASWCVSSPRFHFWDLLLKYICKLRLWLARGGISVSEWYNALLGLLCGSHQVQPCSVHCPAHKLSLSFGSLEEMSLSLKPPSSAYMVHATLSSVSSIVKSH